MYFFYQKITNPQEPFNFACKNTDKRNYEILMGPNSKKRHLKQATTAML